MMKKVLLGACALMMMASCNRTPEEKVAELVKDEIGKSLNYLSSYEMTDMEMDSIAPFLVKDELYVVLNSMDALEKEAQQRMEEKQESERMMQLLAPSATNSSTTIAYEEDKHKVDYCTQRLEEIEKELKELEGKLCVVMTESEGEGGYLVKVAYKAKNDLAEMTTHEVYAIVNHELTRVEGLYETDYLDRIMSYMRDKIVEITGR